VTFGQQPANQFRVTDIDVSRQGTRFTLHTRSGTRQVQLKLLGSHFALASVASVAAAAECGITLDDACAALNLAHGAPRRMAVIDIPARLLTVLDDCYNANPASMYQALHTVQQVRSVGERVILVLGDMLELGGLSQIRHREIGEALAHLTPRPDLVVAVGEDARLIAAEAEKASLLVHTFAASAAAAKFVKETIADFDGPQLLLVKGSRGVHLEEVTRRVTEEIS
jgi:UDP-N-acetylmuramoyl-tripeptide--D-alanyl-D-alanine ligase